MVAETGEKKHYVAIMAIGLQKQDSILIKTQQNVMLFLWFKAHMGSWRRRGDSDMDDIIQKDFLGKRMIELREKNHMSQSDMAELIGCNKSTLSRAEKIGGDTSYKTVLGFAHDLP